MKAKRNDHYNTQ
jgi:hypothetical protein